MELPSEASVMSAFEFSGHPFQAAAPSSLPSISPPSPLPALWDVPRDAAQVGPARHFIGALARPVLRDGDRVQDVRLMVSELLTNAVDHGDGPTIDICVSRTPTGLRVEVHDQGPSGPDLDRVDALLGKHDLLSEDGRGLLLVATYADRWGFAAGSGTTVWVEVDTP